MTPSQRAEEEWARQLIGEALGIEVRHHDAGTSPGMYDLELDLPNGLKAAAEVVAAADSALISLWRAVNGDSSHRWQVDGLVGGWTVSLDPWARGKRVIAELPGLCRLLENEGVRDVLEAVDASYEFARTLGVRSLRQGEPTIPEAST